MKIKAYLQQHNLSQTAFANMIGVFQADVSSWIRGVRKVPVGRCKAVEKATNGLVSVKDLRPEDWHLYWD